MSASTFPAPSPAIELRGVTQSFPDGPTQRVVLDSINLQIARGELVAIMGRSGSGKSTLLNIIAGITQPQAGEVVINGTPLRGATSSALAQLRRTQFGIVFQRNNLIDALTIVENLALPHELNGEKPRIAQGYAELILHEHDLTHLAHRQPHQVSGGQRQLIAALAALSSKRSILLADEPTGELDTAAGDNLMRLIRTHVDSGATGLMVTHDPRDAAWADRIVRIEDGLITTDTGAYQSFDAHSSWSAD